LKVDGGCRLDDGENPLTTLFGDTSIDRRRAAAVAVAVDADPTLTLYPRFTMMCCLSVE
jgi:hypothetical protein